MKTNKESLILNAALSTFATHGFDGCSIRMIAKKAGLNHQKVTYYFKTKENLLVAVLELAFQELHTLGDSLVFDPEKQDPLNQFRQHLKQVGHYFETHPEFLRIIYQETLSNSPRIKLIKPMIQKLRNSVKRELVFLQRFGFGANLPIDQLMLLFSGCFHAYFIHPYVHSEIADPGSYIELNAFVDSICNMLANEVPAPV